MKSKFVVFPIICCNALLAVHCAGAEVPQATDRPGQEQMPAVQPRQDGQLERRPSQGARENEKNHAPVRSAFGKVVSRAAAATVRVLANGQAVALGTVFDGGGYLVSKASLLQGELTCRLADGRELEAEVVGVNEDHDLALLRVAAELAPVLWPTGDVPPPGSLVAAIGPEESVTSMGVISAEPRKIPGTTRPDGQQGWLGVGLGGGQSGLEINMIVRGSAAEIAGLKIGDRVKSIDGAAMQSTEHVVETVGSHASGDTIKLLIERDAKEIELAATLGTRRVRWSAQDLWGGGPFSQRRRGFPVVLTHDAVVHPNDCGGPLVDLDGRAVGINIARALRVATYAIPADVVKEVVDDLREERSQSAK